MRYLDTSTGFVTHLPIYIDASCNALQRYAALAGDPELAVLVNMMPAVGDKRPRDFYQDMADRVHEMVLREAAGPARGSD